MKTDGIKLIYSLDTSGGYKYPSNKSPDIEDISHLPDPSLNNTQTSLEKKVDTQIGLEMKNVDSHLKKKRMWKRFLILKLMAVLMNRCHSPKRNVVYILEAEAESLEHSIDELAINRNIRTKESGVQLEIQFLQERRCVFSQP
ncbi:hypothetical protein NPIL_638271 [Nephila pilipes]|uniref:Uncharacterized protein n=1 Tax=Nephila pilipes TaxID=299642 RepID=A0A8X6TMF9_NEPPI|nr:hypothetical protein NPIL_638271 [Nephila pilipes]